MFHEEENVFYEKKVGFRTVKTTYGEAKKMAEYRGSALKTMLSDLPKDTVIGLSMANSMEWILNFWAVLYAGYSVLLLNLRLDKEALEEAIAQSDCKAVITDSTVYSVRNISETELRRMAETLEKSGYTASADMEPFGSSFLMMTSGTFSHGKVCGYTADRVIAILRNSSGIIKKSPLMPAHYNGELKLLTFLPFYHIFGLVAVYLWFGLHQRTFVELKDMSPETILDTIRSSEVTHIFAVPLLWDKVYKEAMKTIRMRDEKTQKKFEKGMALLDKLDKFPKLSALVSKKAFREVRENLFGESPKFMISGGGFIREDVLRFFNHIGYHLSNGYGMTEIGITSVELSSDPVKLISGTIGKPVDSVEYKINEAGELLAKGFSICSYILEDGRKTIVNPEDWFETKDLVREENGRYFILGRRDDLVVSQNGENLNPNAIERKLEVAGIPDTCLSANFYDGAVHPTLIVSLTEKTSADELKVYRAKVYEKISELHLSESIDKVVFTTTPLIRNDDFKVNRKRIREELQDGTLRIVTPETLEAAA